MEPTEKKRCFVVQGFGEKEDFQQKKKFDLDASYEVIKEAIEDAGLECKRADEFKTSQIIDQPMYEELLSADLVVVDISTLNFNAAYELGVRMALRPYATIVVGEKGLNFPFNISHIKIQTYEHLGKDIGNREARRFRRELSVLVREVVSAERTDSPVYTFLRQLPDQGYITLARSRAPNHPGQEGPTSLRELKDRAKKARDEGDFKEAISLWEKARSLSGKDDFLVQQLALATYKSKQPSHVEALRKAEKILEYLKPRDSFDTETLGLWAAVHKRLYDETGAPESLEQALFALERGFFIKGDYYTGINLAFMLDTQASLGLNPAVDAELRGVARYVRRKVMKVCEQLLGSVQGEERYWVLATLYEASVGLGLEEETPRLKRETETAATADWMRTSTESQIEKLRSLLSSGE